jgi:hypothetical protein
MLFQGQVSPQQLAAGVQANVALGKGAEMLVSEYQGRYYSLAYAGKVFSACNQAAKALTSLSSTYTGHLIYNPLGSGINAIILQCAVAVATAPAGVANMHYEGTLSTQSTAPSSNTANTVFNNLFGNTSIAASASYNVSTLPANPVAVRALGGGPNATGSVTTPFIVDDIAGLMILGPGTYLGLGYLTTAISVVASFSWAELPQ